MKGLNLLIQEENVKIQSFNSFLESWTSWGAVFPVPQSLHMGPPNSEFAKKKASLKFIVIVLFMLITPQFTG